jgi:hypothetical protein
MKNHPAIRLCRLTNLEDGALLSFIVTVNSRKSVVLKYSVGLTGKHRGTSAPWYARLDLDDDAKSTDPCVQPLLHCHVGTDSNVRDAMETRVSLPWLSPHDALDWLLALADTSPPGVDWTVFKVAKR